MDQLLVKKVVIATKIALLEVRIPCGVLCDWLLWVQTYLTYNLCNCSMKKTLARWLAQLLCCVCVCVCMCVLLVLLDWFAISLSKRGYC